MTLREFFSFGILGTIANDPTATDTFKAVLILSATLICIIFPYLLGSMNFAIIISKKRYKADIRNFGSGNAGATNMMRTFGKTAAYLTFLGDALKAFVAGMIGYAAWGQYGVYIAGLFCILGHMFPIYYKFKGGKGVVTAAISILMCNPIVFLILVLIFLLIAIGTKYISLASVMCMLLYPLVLDRVEKLMGGHAGAYLIIAIANALLVVFMHRENIKRLLAGKESKFSFKKSVKPEDKPDTKKIEENED